MLYSVFQTDIRLTASRYSANKRHYFFLSKFAVESCTFTIYDWLISLWFVHEQWLLTQANTIFLFCQLLSKTALVSAACTPFLQCVPPLVPFTFSICTGQLAVARAQVYLVESIGLEVLLCMNLFEISCSSQNTGGKVQQGKELTTLFLNAVVQGGASHSNFECGHNFTSPSMLSYRLTLASPSVFLLPIQFFALSLSCRLFSIRYWPIWTLLLFLFSFHPFNFSVPDQSPGPCKPLRYWASYWHKYFIKQPLKW